MIRAEPRAAVLVMGKPRASGDDPAELTERDNIVK